MLDEQLVVALLHGDDQLFQQIVVFELGLEKSAQVSCEFTGCQVQRVQSSQIGQRGGRVADLQQGLNTRLDLLHVDSLHEESQGGDRVLKHFHYDDGFVVDHVLDHLIELVGSRKNWFWLTKFFTTVSPPLYSVSTSTISFIFWKLSRLYSLLKSSSSEVSISSEYFWINSEVFLDSGNSSDSNFTDSLNNCETVPAHFLLSTEAPFIM
ncbi:hypothetical protein WICPIJ_008289 [Wickerhamomyces pijperi]|uniref:Uncharacterized protein n=1 Tax=Wickerhamomyces pijperi TaxID=599730 RepID=A0A9P8PZJ4_WICPI|nr:hypothetical protein WICPIJ_008289 [Wickerhamomyces pijperi]